MGITSRSFFLTAFVFFLASGAKAEHWIEFHTEKWSQKSGRQKKILLYANRYYYDTESRIIAPSGDMSLWIKETSYNDKLYVRKGAPESETVFRRVHMWCEQKKYEIMLADTDDDRPNELISEKILPGSYYDKLHQAVCRSAVD